MSILLKNAKIFINNEFVSRDVLIEGDKIAEIGTNICSADKVYDVNGMWVIAGAVDVHAHLREPGFENKETVATGPLSAAKGRGYCCGKRKIQRLLRTNCGEYSGKFGGYRGGAQ